MKSNTGKPTPKPKKTRTHWVFEINGGVLINCNYKSTLQYHKQSKEAGWKTGKIVKVEVPTS